MDFRKKVRTALVATALVGMAGSAVAIAILFPAAGPSAVAPPPWGNFNFAMSINTATVANGGYGDQILTVEEGRDDTSPFCQISVLLNPANPAWNPLIGVPGSPYTVQQFGNPLTLSAFYPPNAQIPWPGIPNNPPVPALMLFTYRPTNDPENPGWAGPPATAAVGQLEADLAACHFVAEAFTALRARVAPPNAIAAEWAEIYIDNNPNNASFLEFWKFQIVH